MKHILLLSFFLLFLSAAVSAQNTPGPVEQRVTANICDCIGKLDLQSIKEKEVAQKAFMNCFSSQANLIVDLADERNVSMTDHPAMQALGTEIGKNLLRQNCKGFMQLSMLMAGNTVDENTGVTEGTLKRIETKDFNYFILTDASNKEKSFIWLKQFPGSEEFMNNPARYSGKKLRIEWQDLEVYIPAAKGYYTVKEVTKLEVL